VVIVLVLMGLAAALALPFMRGSLDSLTGAATGRRLVSFLNDAHLRALNTGAPVEVVLSFEERSLTQRIAGKEKERLELPRGVRLTEVETGGEKVTEGAPALTFYPLGDSSGGTIFIEDDRGRRSRIAVGVLFATPVLAVVAAE